jgi:hypothetical protein
VEVVVLEEGVVDGGADGEDGEHLEEHVHFVPVVLAIVEEALDHELGFPHVGEWLGLLVAQAGLLQKLFGSHTSERLDAPAGAGVCGGGRGREGRRHRGGFPDGQQAVEDRTIASQPVGEELDQGAGHQDALELKLHRRTALHSREGEGKGKAAVSIYLIYIYIYIHTHTHFISRLRGYQFDTAASMYLAIYININIFLFRSGVVPGCS